MTLNSMYVPARLGPFVCCLQFQYANYTSPDYEKTGNGSIKTVVINQRYDYAFGFFSGDLGNVSCLPLFSFQL
jgi:hypothetical protein